MKRLIIIFLVILSVIGIVLYTNASNSVHSELGQKNKELKDRINSEGYENKVLAVINGMEISEDIVKSMKQSYDIAGNIKTEEEIFEGIVMKYLLLEKAMDNGIEVSDQAVQERLEEIRKMIHENPEELKKFEDYIVAYGITEEEYYESVKIQQKYTMIIGKYKKDIIFEEFKEEYPNSLNESNNAFSEYYNEYKRKLYEESNISYK